MDPVWISASLSGLAACLAAVAAVLATRPRPDPHVGALADAVDDLRQVLGQDLGAIRSALAEDLRRSRDEAGRHAHQLREGLDGSLDRFRQETERRLGEMRQVGEVSGKALREEVGTQVRGFGDLLGTRLDTAARVQKERLEGVEGTVRRLTETHAEAHEGLRRTVEGRLETLRQENGVKLEEMRRTVDEKLQGTLEQRLGESFKLVSERLDTVHQGLGEMQNLAAGVGDLKRVLTNVKSRGTWAEVSLGALLEQALTADQFDRNVETVRGSRAIVEYAVRLPGVAPGETIWLPIDAKFPVEDYERLLEASDRADPDATEKALQALERQIKLEGAKICGKYIGPPETTDFAVMYLPTEGLYAEVLRRPGLVDHLQSRCKVMVAGPTNLHAFLNSLRMGFRTLAIQQRSGEVQRTLAAVKTEFGKYGEVLESVKTKLRQASDQIDKVAVRKKAIDRTLREVEGLPEPEAAALLAIASSGPAGELELGAGREPRDFLDAAE